MGYAFINFIHWAYILDFYHQYNDKKWTNYNSEKVCKITFGRIQGKNQLISHLKDSKVLKSHNNNVKPLIMKTRPIDDAEIKDIIDKYYRKRFKEKAELHDKRKEEVKSKNQHDTASDQIQLATDRPLPESTASTKTDDAKEPSEETKTHNRGSDSKSPEILFKKEQIKRPASDDDKGASSEDEKKNNGQESSKRSKKLKIQLKNICQTSRGNLLYPS